MKTRTFSRAALAALILALLQDPLAADTFVVDDGGGPGVDFTDLPPAIVAAQTGDLLLVRAGLYSSFTANKGIRILAEPGARVTEGIYVRIELIGPAEIFHVSGLRVHARLRITHCQGTVLMEGNASADPPFREIEVESSADVRIRGGRYIGSLDDTEAIRVEHSFLELVEVLAEGSDQSDGCPPWHGPRGLNALDSTVLVARSTFLGGDGSSDTVFCEGGMGGHGIEMFGGSRLVITGNPFWPVPDPNETFFSRGGDGGLGHYHDIEDGGDGLWLGGGSSARIWGVHFVAGAPNALPIYVDGSSTLEQPTSADPDVLLLGLSPSGDVAGPQATKTASLRVRGEVGSNVRIAVGTNPIVDPHPTIAVPRLVEIEQYYAAGQIGADGTLDFAFKLPLGVQPGDVVIAQADLVPPGGGTTRRTHSLHFMVR